MTEAFMKTKAKLLFLYKNDLKVCDIEKDQLTGKNDCNGGGHWVCKALCLLNIFITQTKLVGVKTKT